MPLDMSLERMAILRKKMPESSRWLLDQKSEMLWKPMGLQRASAFVRTNAKTFQILAFDRNSQFVKLIWFEIFSSFWWAFVTISTSTLAHWQGTSKFPLHHQAQPKSSERQYSLWRQNNITVSRSIIDQSAGSEHRWCTLCITQSIHTANAHC